MKKSSREEHVELREAALLCEIFCLRVSGMSDFSFSMAGKELQL